MRGETNNVMSRGEERGFVLLAVLAFIAFILPVILLVLSTVSTETMSVGEAIKGAKAERAAEQAVESGVSVLLQEKQVPNYWVSKTQENNAIIVNDPVAGVRRDLLVNNGAGVDGIYGTDDDWWIGPRGDRSYIDGDDVADPRNYDYDFRYMNTDGPVYLAQRWAFSSFRNPFFYDPVNPWGVPVELYNQFAAVQGDDDGDGVHEGFQPDNLDTLLLPGYYPSGLPPVGPYNVDLTTGAAIADDMLAYRVRTYEGLYENLEQGPVPSLQTHSYGTITDEAGRLNLNIFCKKLRVWTRESSNYDTRYWDNQVTDDFNNNNMPGELGWHWIDNPLFPDRDTTVLQDGTLIDFGGIDPVTGWPVNTPDGQAWPVLGETLQHYYAPDWVDSAVKSKAMLMMLPGVNEQLAENILRALNPDLSAIPDPPSEDGGLPNADNARLDAPNLTPALVALNVTTGGGGGQITGFEWRYDWYDDDDLPLPPPRPFNDIKDLLNVRGMTRAKFEMLKDYVTVYSYDTNVIQNYIADVSSQVDPVNPPTRAPGSVARPIPGEMIDRDDVPDLRYDLTKYLDDTSMSSLEREADILMAHIRNHLPEGTYKKFTLPVIDREHRGPSDHLGPAPFPAGNDGYPYNVGEAGHEFDIDLGGGFNEPGAEYPALDPPFSRDSALSILLYRYGLTQADAFSHEETPGNPRQVYAGIPIPGTRSFIPILDPIVLIPGLVEFYFQPAYLPLRSAGTNVDAIIPPHQLDSVADLLEVPLYKFSRFSVGIMADPPSDYLCAATGKDEVTVRYMVAMSDVIGPGEYDDSGTPTNLTDDGIANTYDLYFDYNNDGTWEAVVNHSFGNDLRLVTSPPTEDRPGVITTFDQPTGQRYMVFEHTFDLAEVPPPDESLAGTAAGDFAYDAFGNPYITARVLAVKAAGTPEETLADSVVKVYLQENCNAFVPLKVSILAVRTSGDQFMLLSSVGGGVEEPRSFRLYDWRYNGSPQGIDGTVPAQPGGRDPSVVFVTPETDTISLTVYDLYSPGAVGTWPGLPVDTSSTALPPGIVVGNEVEPTFPAVPYPPIGIDTDAVQVELVGTSPNVVAEVAMEPPAIEEGSSALLHLGMYGGVSPYDVTVQVFDGGGGLVQNYSYYNYESNTLTVETDEFNLQGTYSVVLTVTDSTTPVPTSAMDTTTLIVGAAGSNGTPFTNVPNMTVSINLYEVAQPSKGFRASASVSGGRGEYGYFWQVFDEYGQLATGDQGQQLVSNDQSPVFLFTPGPPSDGVYFVKVMVIDQTNINPHNASNTVLATDTEMVVLASPGGDLEAEPIATLAATPPGNSGSSLGENNLVPIMSGSGPAPLIATADPGVPPVDPEVAAIGSVIEIYGYNFNNIPQNNTVTFGNGATAQAFDVQADPSYVGPAPVRQILRVVVPENAYSGWLTVTTNDGSGNGGTSNHTFFQTRFVVDFDAIASINPDTSHTYTMEVDFQGDGIIDARLDTSRMSGSPGQVRHNAVGSLQHDYAQEGFGNYMATLIVTDQTSRKQAVSHQLIQVRNLRPLVDAPNNTAQAFGLVTSITPMYSDRYPLPGMGFDVRSYTGGMSSLSGLKYKWNIDNNGRYALLSTTPPPTPTFWETEPNDASATADVMPVDYDPFTDGASWTGRTSDAADDDWFVLDFPQAGCMTMMMQCFTIVGPQQLTIELYDSGMVLIDSGVISGGGNSAFATTPRNAPAGTYYVHVSGNSAQTYELEATYSPNPGNSFWETEPNDSSGGANVMPIGYDPDRDAFPFTGEVRLNTDPEDWYVLTTTETGTLNLLVQAIDTGPGEEVYATLFDAALTPISTATIAQNDWAAIVGTATDVPPDTFYLRISDNRPPAQRYQIDPSFVAQGSWGGGGPVNFSVSSSISADGRYVNPGVPVNYFAELAFNFNTTDASVFSIEIDPSVPVVFNWDMDGDGVFDYAAPARSVSSELYAAHVRATGSFTFTSVGTYSTGRVQVSGLLLVTDTTGATSTQPFTLPQPAPLPTVDVSNVLSTLTLPALNNNTDHLVSLTVYSEQFDMSTGLTRRIQASDTVHIPSAQNPSVDTFAFLAAEPPYSISNAPGSIDFTLTGIYGTGSDMDFWADLNTDGSFEVGGLGFFNPQARTRVTASNGLNLLNAGAINSFPSILPGVYFQFLDIGIDVEADKGIYNAYALVSDNPGPGETPGYGFDSQPVFVGGGHSGGGGSALPLAVNVFIDPLVGVTTQGFSFESYVSGGVAPYGYNWTIRHVDSGTGITFAEANQHGVPSPLFVPTVDCEDELGTGAALEGTYEIQLVVQDFNGNVAVSRLRYIQAEMAPLSAQLMAVPPSAAVDERVRFIVYVDGGEPPYNININYNDPDDPGATGNVTTSGRFAWFEHSYSSVHLDNTSPANGRFDDPEDGVNVEITVVDARGDTIDPVTSPLNAVQKVLVGERIPLHVTQLVSPSSGISNFTIQVNYAVSGGRKFNSGSFGTLASRLGQMIEGGDYFVVVSLVSSNGDLVDMETRSTRSTIVDAFGSDGVFMNGDVGELYDPVYLYVPYPGNYFVVTYVTDGAGEFALAQQQVFASGYLTPQNYGSTVPKVRRDRDGRPLHAVRVWVDPLYDDFDSNQFRLREADIQIFGDLFTVDPNPSLISPAFLAAKDPAQTRQFSINYLTDTETDSPVDFYDTYTIGRVNINTASETVLAAIFRRIIKERAYYPDDGPDYRRGDRDYANDVYLSESEARALARAVVEYRNAYYDAYKPTIGGGGSMGGFEYDHTFGADPYATGDVRADHLPVIGPWDGVNPRNGDYPDPSSRDDLWPDQGDPSNRNVWDNFRGNYYNVDRSLEDLLFYAPSDIAVVRAQAWYETDEEYAKYLNDTLDNGIALDGEDPLGLDERRGFDARHYFTYDAVNGETRADARNNIAIVNSSGEMAYTYIPNPPFSNIFDLYKVVGVLNDAMYDDLTDNGALAPRTFGVVDTNGDGNMDDVETDSNNFSTQMRTLSGPSLFRYAEWWDAENNEYVVAANYLDDIAAYITTRSYVFRIVGVGGVGLSGGSAAAPAALDRIDRDRAIERVVDVGKMHTAKADVASQSVNPDKRRAYSVLYEDRYAEGGG